MPGIPYQSKLIPYTDFIRVARKKGISYTKLAELLKEEFGVECTYNAVFSFVKSRACRKPVFTIPEATEEKPTQSLRSAQLPKIEEIEQMARKQKPLGKSLLNDDKSNRIEENEEDLWEAVRERAKKDHSKDLVTRKNIKQENADE